MYNLVFDITKLDSYNELKKLVHDTKDGSDDVILERMSSAEIDMAITDIKLLIEVLDALRRDLDSVRDTADEVEEQLRMNLHCLSKVYE